jgi:hypothetical protein
MVGHSVAVEPADQQGLESLLACSQLIVFSCKREPIRAGRDALRTTVKFSISVPPFLVCTVFKVVAAKLCY